MRSPAHSMSPGRAPPKFGGQVFTNYARENNLNNVQNLPGSARNSSGAGQPVHFEPAVRSPVRKAAGPKHGSILSAGLSGASPGRGRKVGEHFYC